MAEAQHIPGLVTPAEASSAPGSTHESGIRFPADLAYRSYPISNLEDLGQIFELLYRRFGMVVGLQCEKTDTALKVGIFPGVYRKSDGTDVSFTGQATFSVPDDTSNYKIWILAADNTVYGGASWPADKTTFVPIAEVDTANGAVTEVEDRRDLLALRIPQALSDNGQTNESTLTIDADATVDGDRWLVLKRTAALAAALKWAQSAARLELYEDKDTSTLAKLNLLELLISGTKLLDANGAAKVASAVAGDGLAESSGVLAVNVDGTTIEISGDALQVKNGGVDTAHLSDALADKLPQVSIGDASGATPQDVTIQILDRQGNNLSEAVYLQVGIYDDADGATEAANATITVQTGTDLSSGETKVKRVKTNASGQAVIRVTDATSETVYLLAEATRRSRQLDCQDYGQVQIT